MHTLWCLWRTTSQIDSDSGRFRNTFSTPLLIWSIEINGLIDHISLSPIWRNKNSSLHRTSRQNSLSNTNFHQGQVPKPDINNGRKKQLVNHSAVGSDFYRVITWERLRSKLGRSLYRSTVIHRSMKDLGQGPNGGIKNVPCLHNTVYTTLFIVNEK